MAPLAAAALPHTAAVAARLDVRDAVGSTNIELTAAVASDPQGWPHLSVLVTDRQTAGRGRLGRAWTAPAGAALAVSVRIDAARIPAIQRGWVPLVAGAALIRALASSGVDATMKWPNDVLTGGRKLCGILTETIPGVADALIIGTGINTAMTADQRPVETATSFALLGVKPDIDALLATYVVSLGTLLDALADDPRLARAAVRDVCSTLARSVEVHLPDGAILQGTAERLDDLGRLVVRSDDGEHPVSAGDIRHLR